MRQTGPPQEHVRGADAGENLRRPVPSESPDAAHRYLELLKGCLTRYLFIDEELSDPQLGRAGHALYSLIKKLVVKRGLMIGRLGATRTTREVGGDWPAYAETMAGLRRLDNVQSCIMDIVRNQVPGDLIEAGVWRGGTSIFMRAVLEALGDRTRVVWVADSFQGLPPPDPSRYPYSPETGRILADRRLSVSLDAVKDNFEKYGLFDERVQFLVGWFKDTLPHAPIERLALLRLDGDLYESTMDALSALYPKLSSGGYVIVDDYGAMASCRKAVNDYRLAEGITEPIETIDWTGAFWRRQS